MPQATLKFLLETSWVILSDSSPLSGILLAEGPSGIQDYGCREPDRALKPSWDSLDTRGKPPNACNSRGEEESDV